MQIFNNIDSNTFSHNGRRYVKNFIVMNVGDTHVAIYGAYDTKLQLLESTHFSEIEIEGNVATSQANAMASLSSLLFVKGGAGASVITNQNNQMSYFNGGTLEGTGPITSEEVSNWINSRPFSFVVGETATPIVFEFQRADGQNTIKYIFFFTRGKGNWGAANGANSNNVNGGTVYNSFFKLISTTPLTPDDIESNDNNVIFNVGSVLDGDYVTALNLNEYELTDPDKTYYFSYTSYSQSAGQNILYFIQFIGEPGVYGGNNPASQDFTINDFVSSTNDNITSNFLPYSGATQDVNLGQNNISALSYTIIDTDGNIPRTISLNDSKYSFGFKSRINGFEGYSQLDFAEHTEGRIQALPDKNGVLALGVTFNGVYYDADSAGNISLPASNQNLQSVLNSGSEGFVDSFLEIGSNGFLIDGGNGGQIGSQNGDVYVIVETGNTFTYNGNEVATINDLAAVSGGSQDLQSVLENGSTASIPNPITISTSGSSLQMGEDVSLSTNGNAFITGSNGFMLQGNAGGQISTDPVQGISIVGNAGGVGIYGNNLGVNIQGGAGSINLAGGNQGVTILGQSGGIFMSGGSNGISMTAQGGNVDIITDTSTGNKAFYNGVEIATLIDIPSPTTPTLQQVLNTGNIANDTTNPLIIDNFNNLYFGSTNNGGSIGRVSGALSISNRGNMNISVPLTGNRISINGTAVDILTSGFTSGFFGRTDSNTTPFVAKSFITKEYADATYTGGTSTSATWGQITGTLSAQTDLQTTFNNKQDKLSGTTNQIVLGDGSLNTRANTVFFTNGPTIVPNNVVVTNGNQSSINNSFQGQLNSKIGSATGSPITIKDIWVGDKTQYSTATTASTTAYFVQDDSQEVKSSISISANGTSIITIPHSLGIVPSYVNVQAKSPSAIGITNIMATDINIIVNYNTPPIGNLQYWINYCK